MEFLPSDAQYTIVGSFAIPELSAVMNELGSQLGQATAETGLIEFSNPLPLGMHNETIYHPKMVKYFLLGSVQPAETGGESLVFDAVNAADIVKREHPELLGVNRTYRINPEGTVAATYPLVVQNPNGTDALRYRQEFSYDTTNNLPDNWTEKDFFDYIDSVLERSTILDRVLEMGEVILVNNFETLHGRRPFTGIRKLIRVRVDDPLQLQK